MSVVTSGVRCVLAGRDAGVREGADARVVAALHRFGLAGLAWAEVPGGDGAPADESLRNAYRASAFRTTLVRESGERALRVLAEGGCEALAFKGVALLQAGIYRDPGARHVEDTDLLVHPDDAPDAVRLLTDAGFVPWRPWRASLMGWLSSFSFTDGNGPAGVEPALDLHWATPYARLRLEGPWGRDPLWDGAGQGLPAPEAHFALICEHFLKHLRVVTHLRGLADLVRLAPHVTDGAALVAQAHRRGSLRGLRNMVAFLRDELEVTLSPDVMAHVATPTRLRGHVARLLDLRRLVEGPAGRGSAGGVLGSMGLITPPGATLAEWLSVVAPPGRWLLARYPRPGGVPRRMRYLGQVALWAVGRGVSPLSPNQGDEG